MATCGWHPLEGRCHPNAERSKELAEGDKGVFPQGRSCGSSCLWAEVPPPRPLQGEKHPREEQEE